MAVGAQASEGSINSTLTQLALGLRDQCAQVLNFSEWVNGLGVAGLEALGFSAADAQTALNLADYMATIAGVYKGTATQGTAFNFDNALSVLWGGS
jgi:hypothetical protein